MGLDGVELVMAFEEEFGISIPDSAAEKMVTPRHVIDFVYEARLAVEKLDAQAHVLGVLAQMGYTDVSLETNFNKLFRSRGRVQQWEELCSKLAPLSAPPARTNGSGCGLIGVGLVGAAAAALIWLRFWQVVKGARDHFHDLSLGAGLLTLEAD